MVSSPILLDFQSSTPCLKEVVEEMSSYWMENFANPSSKGNLSGLYASASLEVSRNKIQEKLNLLNKKIIFTSGATESNNLALLGFARNFKQKTGQYGNIITLKTEHKAVLEPIPQLKVLNNSYQSRLAFSFIHKNNGLMLNVEQSNIKDKSFP